MHGTEDLDATVDVRRVTARVFVQPEIIRGGDGHAR